MRRAFVCSLLLSLPINAWGAQDRCCKPGTDCEYEIGQDSEKDGWVKPDYSDYKDGGALFVPAKLAEAIKKPGAELKHLVLADLDDFLDDLKDDDKDDYRKFRDKYRDDYRDIAGTIRAAADDTASDVEHNEDPCDNRKSLLKALASLKDILDNKKSKISVSTNTRTAFTQTEYAACSISDYYQNCEKRPVKDTCEFRNR